MADESDKVFLRNPLASWADRGYSSDVGPGPAVDAMLTETALRYWRSQQGALGIETLFPAIRISGLSLDYKRDGWAVFAPRVTFRDRARKEARRRWDRARYALARRLAPELTDQGDDYW